MKRKIIFILTIMLLLSFSVSAKNYKVSILSGSENVKKIKNAKISIFLSFNNTNFGKQTLEEGIEKYSLRDKERLILQFSTTLKTTIAGIGKKWDLKIIDDLTKVEDELIMKINVDKITPVVVIGSFGYYTIKIYSPDDLENELLFAALETENGSGKFSECFYEAAEGLGKSIVKCLKFNWK